MTLRGWCRQWVLLQTVAVLMPHETTKALATTPPGTTLKIEIVGSGASKADPVFGTSVVLAVKCRDSCPPFVRIDRVNTKYSNFAGTRGVFFQPRFGPYTFEFGGAPDNLPIPIVISGWSAQYNGTRLTPNSTNATIYYDVSYGNALFEMAVDDLGPATARVTLEPVNTSSPHFTVWTAVEFARFIPAEPATNPPSFKTTFGGQASESGSIVLSFQQPGIYYYGATPIFEGRMGGSSAGGVYDGRPSLHPTALVVAGPDGGTNNQTIPAGFAGTVHKMQPLLTPRQFCIIAPNLTIFSGSQIRCEFMFYVCRPQAPMFPVTF